jgi:hypothetical protein
MTDSFMSAVFHIAVTAPVAESRSLEPAQAADSAKTSSAFPQ